MPVSTTPPTVVRLSGIPLPANNSIDLDRTIILGSDSEWLGRVLFTTPMTVDQVVDFYRREMPRRGWTEFAATRSTTTILAYQADTRVATIQVTGESSNQSPSGTRVEFWSTPRPAGAGTPVMQKTEQPKPEQTTADQPKADQQNTEQQKADQQKSEPQKAVGDASSAPQNLLQGGGATSAAPPPRPAVDEALLPP